MKKIILCFFTAVPCFLFAPQSLMAQTASELETLLGTSAVTYAQAARFVLQAADVYEFGAEEAFRYAMENKWLPAKAARNDGASLDGASLLIMRAFNIKGGAFYAMFKNPHYAYRELSRQNIIQGRVDPDMAVSGDLLLFLVNRVLELKEGGNQ